MVDPNRELAISALQTNINYRFRNLDNLNCALTHSSYRHEARKTDNSSDNERLEFLGDAVLNFVISNHLYQEHPDLPEGRLARLKAVIVSEPILAAQSRELGLGNLLLLGKGEIKSGGANRNSILGDTFEAIIGAVYLDGGIEAAKAFILRQLEKDIHTLFQEPYLKDHKSVLQEYVQAQFMTIPTYQLSSESGPDHDKRFVVKVSINGEEKGTGEGKSKKEAEQKAAEQACILLSVSKPKYTHPPPSIPPGKQSIDEANL